MPASAAGFSFHKEVSMENLIFNVLMALVVAIVGIIAKTLLPYLKAKEEEALAKLRRTKWSWAADIIDAVVRAVEQTVSDEMHGDDKKALAVKYITELLNQNGISLSDKQIDALIEAAVHTMNDSIIDVTTDVDADETETVKIE